MGHESRHAAWIPAAGCVVAAGVATLAFSAAGQPRFGVALAAGLLLGGLSGPVALWTLYSGLPFRIASLARLGVQSVLAVGIGYLLGDAVIWVPVAGLAASNVILGGYAIRGALAVR